MRFILGHSSIGTYGMYFILFIYYWNACALPNTYIFTYRYVILASKGTLSFFRSHFIVTVIVLSLHCEIVNNYLHRYWQCSFIIFVWQKVDRPQPWHHTPWQKNSKMLHCIHAFITVYGISDFFATQHNSIDCWTKLSRMVGVFYLA